MRLPPGRHLSGLSDPRGQTNETAGSKASPGSGGLSPGERGRAEARAVQPLWTCRRTVGFLLMGVGLVQQTPEPLGGGSAALRKTWS